MVSTKTKRGRRPTSADNDDFLCKEPITGESLRALVHEKRVFGPRSTLPSKGAFERAAGTLNVAARCEALRKRPDDWGEDLEKTVAALRLLSACYGPHEFEDVAMPASPLGQECRVELKRVERELAIHRVAQSQIRRESRHRVRWQAIADAISTVFDKLAAPKVWGVSEAGPRVKFVTAVIPLITSESPTVGAVSLRLKKSVKVKR